MPVQVEIENQCRDLAVQPEWEAFVHEQVRRLAVRHPRMLRLHVTFKHGRHHRQGRDEVALLAAVPGGVLRAAKEEERMVDALHAAFESLERKLDAHEEALSGEGQRPGARGIVHRLFPDGGFGFLLLPGGQEVYFHRDSLRGGLDFDWLEVGQPVLVEIGEGREGPQAASVFPVSERWAG